MNRFLEKLRASARRHDSLLCVGLDPDIERLPAGLPRTADGVVRFLRGVVEATAELVCAYKPNLSFYEALGRDGWETLRATLDAVPRGIPVIADAKRGDVGPSAAAYARALFDVLDVDAATVSPYLGGDALAPLLERDDRCLFVLCKTSNPGSAEFQDLLVRIDGDVVPLYRAVARRVVAWNRRGNCGLVVGATYPRELAAVRQDAPTLPILIPGVGPQQGDLEASVRAGLDREGGGAMVNASRQVLYASTGADWQEAARRAAADLREALARARRTALQES